MPTADTKERLAAVLPAFAQLETIHGPLTADLKRQGEHGSIFTLELEELEAIAARLNEMQELCRQNALVSL